MPWTEHPATIAYFRSWVGSYAGQFLNRDGHVDRITLLDMAGNFSTGEQVYAAIWWELCTASPAPWMDGFENTALARFHHLDLDHQANAVQLLQAVHHENVLRQLK